MKIEYLGHSCFLLTESTGISIVTDPYSAEIGYEMPKVSADIVTISHDHYDHNNISAVSNVKMVIKDQEMVEYNGVTITGVKAYHDDDNGKLRGETTIYKYRMDGIDICHLGDIGHECTLEMVESLLPINVLFIPVGGNYTIDAEMAANYIEKLMPDIVIPMHYKTKSLLVDLDKLGEFLSKYEDEEIVELDSSELYIDRNDLNSLATKIMVLKRKK